MFLATARVKAEAQREPWNPACQERAGDEIRSKIRVDLKIPIFPAHCWQFERSEVEPRPIFENTITINQSATNLTTNIIKTLNKPSTSLGLERVN